MKRMWLTLSIVMVILSACTAETFPILIPYSEEPTDRLTEEDSGKSLCAFRPPLLHEKFLSSAPVCCKQMSGCTVGQRSR